MRKQPLLALMSTTLTLTTIGIVGRSPAANAGVRAARERTTPSTARRSPRAVPAEPATVARPPQTVAAPAHELSPTALVARAELALFSDERARTTRPTAPKTTPSVARAGRGGGRAVARAATQEAGGVWLELRRCESGDNYRADTGNGYYGAYQFSLPTWQGIGFAGMPNEAPPAVQDRAARVLEAEWGWDPWPVCSVLLGLR